MANIKAQDLPEKLTKAVKDDRVLMIDSEDYNRLKTQPAEYYRWDDWVSPTVEVVDTPPWTVPAWHTVTITDKNWPKSFFVKDWWWDMEKAVYDKNDNGIVDDAEHAEDADNLWWKPASAYAEKTWIKTINNQSLIWEWNITIEWWSGGDSIVKIFTLETSDFNSEWHLTDLTKAQAIYDWVNSWKDAVIYYDTDYYRMSTKTSDYVIFELIYKWNEYSLDFIETLSIYIFYDSWTVTDCQTNVSRFENPAIVYFYSQLSVETAQEVVDYYSKELRNDIMAIYEENVYYFNNAYYDNTEDKTYIT